MRVSSLKIIVILYFIRGAANIVAADNTFPNSVFVIMSMYYHIIIIIKIYVSFFYIDLFYLGSNQKQHHQVRFRAWHFRWRNLDHCHRTDWATISGSGCATTDTERHLARFRVDGEEMERGPWHIYRVIFLHTNFWQDLQDDDDDDDVRYLGLDLF